MKGSLMRLRNGAFALALGILLAGGCGPVSNEEDITGGAKVVPTKPGMENIKSFGDIQRFQAEQAKQRQAEKRAKTPKKSRSKEAASPRLRDE